MSRQLQAEGQKVDLLVLIEPAFPHSSHALAHSVISHIGKMLRISQETQLDYFLRVRHTYKYMRGQRLRAEDLKAFRNIDPSILTLIPTTYALRQDDNALLDWAIAEYHYDTYSDKIMLIRASEEPFGSVWQRKVYQEKNIELSVVPGTHIGCRTEHIQELAEALGKCFSKA
jgi:hypothetical protein